MASLKQGTLYKNEVPVLTSGFTIVIESLLLGVSHIHDNQPKRLEEEGPLQTTVLLKETIAGCLYPEKRVSAGYKMHSSIFRVLMHLLCTNRLWKGHKTGKDTGKSANIGHPRWSVVGRRYPEIRVSVTKKNSLSSFEGNFAPSYKPHVLFL